MKMKDFDDIKSDFKNRNVLGSEEERSFYSFIFFVEIDMYKPLV